MTARPRASGALAARAGGWSQGAAAEQRRALPSWRDLRLTPALQGEQQQQQQQSLAATS